MRIEGSVALVSGANRGIGQQLARDLLARGATKVYAAARDPRSVTVEGVEPVALDVTDPASVSGLAEVADDVTLLVNNAGVYLAQSLVDGDLATMRREFDTNAIGMLLMTRAFAPALVRRRGGAVVNVLSASSWFTYPGSGSYAMSKAAAWSLTNGVRVELAPHGVQVVGVHVGLVDTDMTARLDVPKASPAACSTIVLDGVELGATEIVTDDLASRAKAALAGPPGVTAP